MSRYDRDRERKRVLTIATIIVGIAAIFFAFGKSAQQSMDAAGHDMVEER